MEKSNQWRSKVNAVQCITYLAGILCLTSTSAFAMDWPQYRGPNQDGISTEKLNPAWLPAGPKLLWKIPIAGYGSFAVCGNQVFALAKRENKGQLRELCVALDVATGKELWAADVTLGRNSSPADSDKTADGPRSTPTVNDGKVYVYSTDAKLCCFDAQTGKELWRVDVLKDCAGAGSEPKWGNSSSPVVDGDLVMVAGGGPGQSVLGINKKTGQVVWKAGDAISDFNTTPVVATIHGQRQAIFRLGNNLAGISIKDGKILWQKGIAWYEATAWSPQPQPIVQENKIWYGNILAGCNYFQIMQFNGGFYGKWIWDMNIGHWNLPYGSPVLHDDHLYGNFGPNPAGSFSGDAKPEPIHKKANIQFKCVKIELAATNKDKWVQKGFGKNDSVTLIGDKLVILSETGELILVEAKPDAYKELARFKALAGQCWAAPAFSNGHLYIRSNNEGACFDLSTK